MRKEKEETFCSNGGWPGDWHKPGQCVCVWVFVWVCLPDCTLARRNEHVSMDWMLTSVTSGGGPNIDLSLSNQVPPQTSGDPSSHNTDIHPCNRDPPPSNKIPPPGHRSTPTKNPPPPHSCADQWCPSHHTSHSHCKCQYGISCFAHGPLCPSVHPCSLSAVCSCACSQFCHCRPAVKRGKENRRRIRQRLPKEEAVNADHKGGRVGEQSSSLKTPCAEGGVVLGGRGSVGECDPCPVRYNPNTSASFFETSLGSSEWDVSLTAEGRSPRVGRWERVGDRGGGRTRLRSRSASERETVRWPLKDTMAHTGVRPSLDVSVYMYVWCEVLVCVVCCGV